jgi:acyl carrier protein
MNEFNEGLAEILEVNVKEIQPDFVLGELWDSLAIVSTIALVDDCHGVVLEGDDLHKCEKISDILNLISKSKQA